MSLPRHIMIVANILADTPWRLLSRYLLLGFIWALVVCSALWTLTVLQRLLDHLEEAGFYSSKDLNSITKTLESTRETLERGRNTYSPALLTLLESRLEQCEQSLAKLQKGLAVLAPPLAQTHETLVSILRSTSAVNTRSKVRYRIII